MPDILPAPPVSNKRIVTDSGTTGAAGTVVFTFSPAFAAAPHVSPEMVPSPNTETFIRLSAVSASGCTVHCFARSGLTVLGLSLLSLATTNVAGVPVSILAVDRA